MFALYSTWGEAMSYPTPPQQPYGPAAEGYVQIEVTPDWESTTAIFAGKVD